MKLPSKHKVNQQRRILLLALYLLKHRCGRHSPEKRMVLRFINSQHLMHVPTHEEESRSTGNAIWENDLAWKREDLKEVGLLRMPQHGVWQITEHGERSVEAWADQVRQFTKTKPDWQARLNAHLQAGAELDAEFHLEYYLTEEAVRAALAIPANRAL
jgi:hypothetical protein